MPIKDKKKQNAPPALTEMQATVERLSEQVARLEQRAHETHERADKAHKRAEKLHSDSTGVRKRAQGEPLGAQTTRRKLSRGGRSAK